MSFILSAQRDNGLSENLRANWERYQAQLKAAEDRLPSSAFKLATSDWWYAPDRPEAPHDSRLLGVRIRDVGAGTYESSSKSEIEVELHSAYEGTICLHYPTVYQYAFTMPAQADGVHNDWRYDEFRVTEAPGRILHVIEWACGAVWQIEASDLIHEYIPPSGSDQNG